MRVVLAPIRHVVAAAAIAGAATSLLTWGFVSAAVPDPVSVGERFYMEGRASRGAVNALVQHDVRVRSTDMPCVNCHRRSAWGSAEGPLVVPPVVGSILFAPLTQGAPQMGTLRTTGPGTRPAYTNATLLRAVRDGIAPDGRELSATMPRYEIGAADADALAGYLKGLSAHPPPGVTASTVRLATIVTAGVSAGQRASMLDVLHTYVRYKNGGTRHETRRRERGPWDMKQEYDNYRDWILDEWTLTGPSSSWPAQLEARYRAQPVFALVAGLSDQDWTPVHDFAERHHVPVILPQAPLTATTAASSFYSLYFSRGLLLEVRAVAERLERAGAGAVVQLSRCGSSGDAAAAALVQARRSARVRTQCVPAGAVLSGPDWRSLLADHPATVVAWLDLADLAVLGSAPETLAGVNEIYLSSTLLHEDLERVPAAFGDRAIVVEAFVPPDDLDRHAARAMTWMHANSIEPVDRPVAINTLFAATLASDALGMPRTLASREYFIERIEHMAARTPNRSAYPAIRFDTGQRFGSASCSLLRLPATPGGTFRKVEEWFVPRP